MRSDISDEVIKKATKCLFEQRCLTDDPDFIKCEIERSIQDQVLLLKERSKNFCPYCISFGFTYICTCPVRSKLFQIDKK